MIPEPIAVTLLVTEALERLGVAYLVGGSFASTVHGEMRTTLDSDLVADLRLEHAEPLANALGSAFYVDERMIREAIGLRSSFNVIHLSTMFKVDVFIPKRRAYDREQMKRRARLCWLLVSSADSEGLGSRAHALVQPFVELRLA